MSYLSTLADIVGGTYNSSTGLFTSNGDLIAHYKLDDSTATIADAGTNNCDLTIKPDNANGTNYRRRQGTLLPSDSAGRSIWFDGVLGRAYDDDLKPALRNSRDAYTINVWCQPDPQTSYSVSATTITMIGIRNKYQLNCPGGSRYEFAAYDNGASQYQSTRTGTYDFVLNYGTINPNTGVFSVNGVDPANSLMVTGVFTGVDLYIYVNGILFNKKSGVNLTDPTAAGALGIGSLGNGNTGTFYGGWIQHASVIKTALGPNQIQTLYKAGIDRTVPLSVTVTSWSSTIVASNASRKKVTLTNDSPTPVWLSFGGVYTSQTGIALKPYGGTWSTDTYTGDISGIVQGFGYAYIGVMEET